MDKSRTVTYEEWLAEAKQKFGNDPNKWAFVCPACGYVATIGDWKAAGAPEDAIAFSCIGRWLNKAGEAFEFGSGPCHYVGGGFIRLNPVTVVGVQGQEWNAFEFAEV